MSNNFYNEPVSPLKPKANEALSNFISSSKNLLPASEAQVHALVEKYREKAENYKPQYFFKFSDEEKRDLVKLLKKEDKSKAG